MMAVHVLISMNVPRVVPTPATPMLLVQIPLAPTHVHAGTVTAVMAEVVQISTNVQQIRIIVIPTRFALTILAHLFVHVTLVMLGMVLHVVI